ncbi:uncharacterized protein LOC110426416 [Herrania umbratica]|uniref:Uncharacterized protein LOC110426416 n=1 Tax=Herrania umbratica TaxID=108875 RepID=A0A6J1BDC5_9ROSI|nr:uncharacterized protein LOC110426416 [Herrania umbratica]
MKAYLRAFDLQEVVKVKGEPPVMRYVNPTITQIKKHSEEVAKHYKALSCIHSTVTDSIFTRIMACESPKEAWDKLKEEFHGSDKTRQIQVLNLMREFEVLKMREDESIKDYFEKVLKIVNQLRLLGEELSDRRIVHKFLVSLPEKFEAKISSLEDSKDMSKLLVTELINALQAQEQRRAIRQGGSVESALTARTKDLRLGNYSAKKHDSVRGDKEKKNGDGKQNKRGNKFPPCQHCKKRNHTLKYCWYRPNVRPNVKCRSCNHFGHVEKVCKAKNGHTDEKAAVADQVDATEEQLFMAQIADDEERNTWLIDSGCSNHLTGNDQLFTKLDRNFRARVRIGNGIYLKIMGIGTVVVETVNCTKYISEVHYVPEVTQNLPSVGQLAENHYTLLFKEQFCTIFDPSGDESILTTSTWVQAETTALC